jgi:hypothetical protein
MRQLLAIGVGIHGPVLERWRGRASHSLHEVARPVDTATKSRVGRVETLERRKLIATAGALSVSAFAGTVAIGATFGMFNLTQPDSPTGHLASNSHAAVVTAPPPRPSALSDHADD